MLVITVTTFITTTAFVGVQNESPQNVPLV